MAIVDPIQEVTLRLKKETTSRETRLRRFVQRNAETGFIEAQFPIEIDVEAITYELDALDNKTDIYDTQNLGSIFLEPGEIFALWTTQVTLADTTVTTLGDLLSARIDEIIAARFAPPTP